MARLRRNLLFSASAVLMALLLVALFAHQRWVHFKQAQHLEVVELAGLRLTTNGIALRQLVLVQMQPDGTRLALEADDLRLELDAWWRPLPLRSLELTAARVSWQPGRSEATEEDEPPSLPEPDALRQWATWIPSEGRIEHMEVTLPCVRGQCTQAGTLNWRHAGEPVWPARLQLALSHDDHRLELIAEAAAQDGGTQLDVDLLLDDQPRLTSQNRFTPLEGKTAWLGSLSLSALPEAPWLLEWLGNWLAETPATLPELPEQMRLGAGWELTLDTRTLPQDWTALAGNLRLSANLPAPWPVVGIGQVQGRLDLSAKAENGLWIPVDLAADLVMRPEPEPFAVLPPALRPSAVSLKITPVTASTPTAALPFDLHLTTSGPSPLTLDGRVTLQTTAPYMAELNALHLTLRSPKLTSPQFTLNELAADLRLTGTLSPQAASLLLEKDSRLTLGSLLTPSDVDARRLSADLAGTTIETGFTPDGLTQLALSGTPRLSLGELRHPVLRPQGWQWSGTLIGDRSRVSLDGPLSNDAGLSLPLLLAQDLAGGTTRVDAKLPELFLRAGNPLADTLTDWPRVLTLGTGRLQGQLQLQISSTGTPTGTATLSAKGLGGIYDRTELSGMDAELSLALQDDQLRLDVPVLSVREANPGFTFGPLRLDGSFTGPLENLAQGRLTWRLAEVGLLGGRLWLEPGIADLAAPTQQLDAHLRGLQLPALLEAYPAEGLSGTGVIDGEMQVMRSDAGISIEQGSLKAREPGGALQFRSAQIQALGQSNPAMRLVTEALDDFHYDLLTGDVHYAADGALTLGLKLHGRNPALEGGRPINFAINLEEDIPALLTSLQLSDRVSETIQRRVQERLGQERK